MTPKYASLHIQWDTEAINIWKLIKTLMIQIGCPYIMRCSLNHFDHDMSVNGMSGYPLTVALEDRTHVLFMAEFNGGFGTGKEGNSWWVFKARLLVYSIGAARL